MWIRMDDKVMGHPKILALSDRTFRLWMQCLIYSGLHETDGWVPANAFKSQRRQLAQLVHAGLLHAEGDLGYRIHDWGDYQTSSDVIQKRRAQARERWHRWQDKQRD